MDSISKIKRMSNNHGKQETPTFGEIKSLIVNKIISDNKLNILKSKYSNQKYSHRPTILSVSNFDDNLSEISIYGKCKKTKQIVNIYHKKKNSKLHFKKNSKFQVFKKRKIEVPENVKKELQNIATGMQQSSSSKSRANVQVRSVDSPRLMSCDVNAKAAQEIKNINQKTMKFTAEELLKQIKARLLKQAFTIFKKKTRFRGKVIVLARAAKRSTKCSAEVKFSKIVQLFRCAPSRNQNLPPITLTKRRKDLTEKQNNEDFNSQNQVCSKKFNENFRNYSIKRSKCKINLMPKIVLERKRLADDVRNLSR